MFIHRGIFYDLYLKTCNKYYVFLLGDCISVYYFCTSKFGTENACRFKISHLNSYSVAFAEFILSFNGSGVDTSSQCSDSGIISFVSTRGMTMIFKTKT